MNYGVVFGWIENYGVFAGLSPGKTPFFDWPAVLGGFSRLMLSAILENYKET